MKKRLFISIPLDAEAQAKLVDAQERSRYRFLRWVDPSQFHLTLCFLGDTEEDMLVLVSDALSTLVSKEKPFDLKFDHIGLFPPKLAHPNMVWAFFEESESFEGLVKRTKDGLMKSDPSFMRLAEEWRKDIPHVTLARFRGSDYPRQFPQPTPMSLRVNRLELMESVLYPDGPVYHTLATFPFAE